MLSNSNVIFLSLNFLEFNDEIKDAPEGNGYVLENVYTANGDDANGKRNSNIGIIA